jgi:hypothetical protein
MQAVHDEELLIDDRFAPAVFSGIVEKGFPFPGSESVLYA